MKTADLKDLMRRSLLQAGYVALCSPLDRLRSAGDSVHHLNIKFEFLEVPTFVQNVIGVSFMPAFLQTSFSLHKYLSFYV